MRKSLLAITAGLTVTTTQAAAQNAEEVFAERGYALAMDELCELFTADQRDALSVFYLQARGALIRAGENAAELDDYRTSLDDAAAEQGCQSEHAQLIYQRVNEGYAGFERLMRMSFPADQFSWEANAPIGFSQTEWLARQDAAPVAAGLALINGELEFVVDLPQVDGVTSAVLVLRDMGREPELYDPTVGGLYPTPQHAPWLRWSAPDYARQLVFSRGRVASEPAFELNPADARQLYRFSVADAERIAQRDPREAARIDLMDRRGERITSYFFEVGDLGAAIAFVRSRAHLNQDESGSTG